MFLLTDFGTSDEFAGVVRAVVVRDAPGCPVVDLTHEVPAFDVRGGALALERCISHLGPGVVVAVVDPGVGTRRRAVAVSVEDAAAAPDGTAMAGGPAGPGIRPRFLVGPDNGVLSFAIDCLGGATGAVSLGSSPQPGFGATFDARDVFAPAAARLWRGSRLPDLGPPVDVTTLVHLDPPHVEVARGSLSSEVIWVDRFGNVQLAARPADEEEARLGGDVVVVTPNGRFDLERAATFGSEAVELHRRADDDSTEVVRLITDSNGRLALVSPLGSAATVLGVRSGEVLRLESAGRPYPAVASERDR